MKYKKLTVAPSTNPINFPPNSNFTFTKNQIKNPFESIFHFLAMTPNDHVNFPLNNAIKSNQPVNKLSVSAICKCSNNVK